MKKKELSYIDSVHRDGTIWNLSVMALLLASLLDCHFFNVGPVLFYSMALAYAEKIERSKM